MKLRKKLDDEVAVPGRHSAQGTSPAAISAVRTAAQTTIAVSRPPDWNQLGELQQSASGKRVGMLLVELGAGQPQHRLARHDHLHLRYDGASGETMDDGLFRSGDIGEIDEDGFIPITGRKKELIVTAGGKNVAPAVLEDRLRAHPLMSQCMVVGDQQPYLACLVTIDPEALAPWAAETGKPADVPALVDDSDLIAEMQGAVETPSLKLKRSVVMKEFGEVVEALYAAPSAV